jgi:hypothetical protein
MIELGLLLLLVVAAIAAAAAIGAVIKVVLWAVLLPVRMVLWILGGLLFLPFLAVKLVFAVIGFIGAAVGVLVGVVAFAVFGAIFLLPVLCAAALIGLAYHLVRPALPGATA